MIITSDDLLKLALKDLKTTLIRGYPCTTIDREIKKISHLSQHEVIYTTKEAPSQGTRRLVFSFPNTIHIPELKEILRKHWFLIENDPTLKNIWNKPPTVAVKRHKTLRETLVRSKTLPVDM